MAGGRFTSVVSNQLTPSVRSFFLEVAASEKHWPAQEVAAVLDRQSILVWLAADERIIGAAQILFERPYPVEKVFPDCIPHDGRKPCQVTLLAIDRQYRWSASGGDDALAALVKSIYRTCIGMGVTHVYALFEERTIAVFERYVRVDIRRTSPGAHYWCGTDTHSDACQLTYACALDMRASERRWQVERPEFWAYLRS